MISAILSLIFVGCDASELARASPGDPLPVVLANYDYSDFVIGEGELLAVSDRSRVGIKFAIGASGMSKLRISLKGRSIDLTDQFKGLGGYPTRIQVSSYDTSGSGGGGIIISLPYQKDEHGCYTRNVSIERGRLTETSDSPTSALRCVR